MYLPKNGFPPIFIKSATDRKNTKVIDASDTTAPLSTHIYTTFNYEVVTQLDGSFLNHEANLEYLASLICDGAGFCMYSISPNHPPAYKHGICELLLITFGVHALAVQKSTNMRVEMAKNSHTKQNVATWLSSLALCSPSILDLHRN